MKRKIYEITLIIISILLLISCFNNPDKDNTGAEILSDILNEYGKDAIAFNLFVKRDKNIDMLVGTYRFEENDIIKSYEDIGEIESYKITEEYIEIGGDHRP